jgi:hypothetical protein
MSASSAGSVVPPCARSGAVEEDRVAAEQDRAKAGVIVQRLLNQKKCSSTVSAEYR